MQSSKHFSAAELACKCGRRECDATEVAAYALEGLEKVREDFGKAMELRSGARCAWWNAHPGVKGAKDSRHVTKNLYDGVNDNDKRCDAFDIECYTSADRYRLIELGIKHGARGIGVGKTFVHLDWRPAPFPRVCWLY